jgi:hypothetical protein
MEDLHNIGLIDRVARFVCGGTLLFAGAVSSVASGRTEDWQAALMLLAIYPLMTAIIGWDPLYQIMHVRTGTDTGKNVTGTFPFQLDAALGHHPVPDKDYEYDHSLSGSHHEPFVKQDSAYLSRR